MSINERQKYCTRCGKRYRSASRKEKGYLLDEMQAVTGMHRKSLIRMLTGRLSRKPRRRERGRTCGAAVEDGMRVIARGLLDAPLLASQANASSVLSGGAIHARHCGVCFKSRLNL
ncbi:MAG: hypothetical protein KatS3mg045_1318 [Bellilinea sp.]|nr:MAG: hypothetical protein KatS3mg045_1318 [Bellilinea sp.]